MTIIVVAAAVQNRVVQPVITPNHITVSIAQQGPPGPAAPAGRVFVQNVAPMPPGGNYLWIQTGLGAGTDITFWIEDNLP